MRTNRKTTTMEQSRGLPIRPYSPHSSRRRQYHKQSSTPMHGCKPGKGSPDGRGIHRPMQRNSTTRRIQDMETIHAMNKQKLLRELRQVSKHCTERIKVYTEARKQIQNTIRKIKSPAPTPEPTGDIPIEIIAELLGKGKISKAGKTKAVKRATIGIKHHDFESSYDCTCS